MKFVSVVELVNDRLKEQNLLLRTGEFHLIPKS